MPPTVSWVHEYLGVSVAGTQTSAATDCAVAGTASPDPAPYAAAGSQAFYAPPSPMHHAHLQQQQPYVGQYQPPNWSTAAGLGSETLPGPGSHASSCSPPPWLQQQQQQQPGFGLLQPQQPMMQQAGYPGWPALQQQQWPDSTCGPPLGFDHPAYTTTAIAPSYHNSMGSSYSPNSISPGRGFQAGVNAAAAVAAMQAAAARSGGLGPLAGGWGLSPTAAAAAEAPFAQQQWLQQHDTSSRGPGGAFGAQPSFNPAGFGGAPAGPAGAGASLGLIAGGVGRGGSGDSSSTSPLRARGGVQDKARKDAYRAELEAQIRERSQRQAAEKAQRAAQESRKEAEMAAYCPWGRGGAGAPLRDAAGQVGVGVGSGVWWRQRRLAGRWEMGCMP